MFHGEKFELYPVSFYLVAEYFREVSINVYLSLMFICTLTALKKSSKMKETEIEKEIVELLKHANDQRKKAGK